MIFYTFPCFKRFTKTDFCPCLIYPSYSQTPLFYQYTIVSNFRNGILCEPLLHFKRRSPQSNCHSSPSIFFILIFISHLCLINPLASFSHRLWIIFLILILISIQMITVKLLGSFCPATIMSYLHDKYNFTGITLETVEDSLIHSYLSTINRRLTALHYYGQSYRIHLIVFIIFALTIIF